jgi:CHRD domain/PEP-CTERM motif
MGQINSPKGLLKRPVHLLSFDRVLSILFHFFNKPKEVDMKKFNLITAGLLLAAIGTPAAAVDSVYTTTLSGPAESPPNHSPGTGTAMVTIDKDHATMHVQDNFKNLLQGTTEAHIHCCTDVPGAGNSTIGIELKDFPLGVTSGSYDHTFNMLDASNYDQAFIDTHGGTASRAFSGLVAGIAAGEAYVNIHTNLYLDGEIRGFLAAIPEPETYAMMLAGLGLLGWRARRALL